MLAEQGLVHSSGDRWTGRASRIRPTPSAFGRSRRTTSSSSTRRTSRASSARRTSRGAGDASPKAIYIVEGKLFQVEKLDFEGRKAFVREIDCDYYTDAITYTRVTSSIHSERMTDAASRAGP